MTKKEIKKENIGAGKKEFSNEFTKHFPTMANNPNKWSSRLVISTPTVGTVRMEWVQGRFGQTIPTNFSLVDIHQFCSPYAPIGFQVADAENLSAKVVVEGNFDWFLSWEDDNVPPLDALVKLMNILLNMIHQ